MKDNFIFFPEDTRMKIINALKECQDINGNWCYPPQRKDTGFISVWTTAQVVWALLLSGTKPRYYDEALKILSNYDIYKENGKLLGWIHENTSELGICITADCCIAFMLSNRCDEIKYAIENLINIQLSNGIEKMGWGYTISDKTSRVTATCWAVRTLIYASQEDLLKSDKLFSAIKFGINWLISAANLDSENGGWGETCDAQPKVSCTAWAILTILESTKLECLGITIEAVKENVLQGIKTIKKLYSPQYKGWIGSPEGYGTLRMKGLGSSIVLIALVEVINWGLLDIDDVYVRYALEEIETEKDGWITPNYKETQIYENVFWLLALSKFERFYLKSSKELEKKYTILKEKYYKLIKWNLRILIWFLIGILGYLMYRIFTLYANNPIVPIFQSIIATFLWEVPLKKIVKKIKDK